MSYHESPHPLRLLLLLPLRVGVPGGDGPGELLDFARHGAVVLLKVFGVLKDAVQIFLGQKEEKRTRDS